MADLKHTPGPWLQADEHGPNEQGTAVQEADGGRMVCSCTGYFGSEAAVANAKLIAVAPELRDALMEMVSFFGDRGGPKDVLIPADYQDFPIDMAMRVLAKAEGCT